METKPVFIPFRTHLKYPTFLSTLRILFHRYIPCFLGEVSYHNMPQDEVDCKVAKVQSPALLDKVKKYL